LLEQVSHLCGRALGAGRVNAFCTAWSRPSANMIIACLLPCPPLSAPVTVTVTSLMYRAGLGSGALNRSRTSSPPQDGLGARAQGPLRHAEGPRHRRDRCAGRPRSRPRPPPNRAVLPCLPWAITPPYIPCTRLVRPLRLSPLST
jgi:hypothetical protein